MNQIERVGISELFDQLIESDRQIEILSNSFTHEQFDFFKYLVPLLHDKKKLDISFWFLEGNSDDEIQKFLEEKNDSQTASQLLFNTNPILCGYREYEDFLYYLKKFYSELSDPESMHISGDDHSYLKVSLFNKDHRGEDRTRVLIHTPLPTDDFHWELPFSGKLYYMMIHQWPLDQYCGISIQDSPLANQFLLEEDKEKHISAQNRVEYLLLMGVAHSYKNLEPIEAFVNESNVTDALEFFPNQIIREKLKPASYFVNRKIGRIHRKNGKALKQIYNEILGLFPGSRS